MVRYFIFLILICLKTYIYSQNIGNELPTWNVGELEIHHIFTGGGEAVFSILPDGTTLLIDAGDTGPHIDPRKTPIMPNDSKNPGEWIARYVEKRIRSFKEPKLDYALITHFHNDHMGGVYENSIKSAESDYFLSGITEVYEHIKFDKIIDRGWPEYDFPMKLVNRNMLNYYLFLSDNISKNGLVVEKFEPGKNDQIKLKYFPEDFPKFEIRNIVSNGEVWLGGESTDTKNFFPLGEERKITENMCSNGVKITYGKFDYFNGGDLSGRVHIGDDKWRDIESVVGKYLGEVEVCEANHHGWV